MKLIKKLIFCVAFISCSVYAQFFPYTDITIDVQDENRQFSVDREYYGTTPFYEFTITDNGSAVDLSGWDFALKYGYDKNADVLYTFTGSDYISVTNNKVLVNGTTNYWFEPHNDYYIALEGTYSSGNYKYIFAEGSMNVTYSPASDEDVNNILNGLTFTLLRITDFVAYTNYINSTVRPEDLGSMAYAETNDFASSALTNNISALEARTNTWNSAVQPEDLGTAAYSNATDFATAAQGALAVSAVQPEDLGTMAYAEANDYYTSAAADLVYVSRDGSEPMTGDLDMDGYDIDDAGIVDVDGIKMIPDVPVTKIIALQMPLALDLDAKCGYIGPGDYIGAAGGSGFYAIASASTNQFNLAYLSTNNYIMVQSPLISTTSNFVEKITGYGTCTSNNYPVAGLVVGDNYVTFAHNETISRTNLVNYTRFGSKLATINPTANYSFVNIDLSICGHINVGFQRNEKICVLLSWTTDFAKPYRSSIVSYMRTDYPVNSFIEIKTYNNDIVMFGLYHTTSYDNSRSLVPGIMAVKADALCNGAIISD